MKIVVTVLSILLLCSCRTKESFIAQKGPNTLSPAEKALGWELLFDGRSMDHWRVYKEDMMRGWAIRENAMIALGNKSVPADIITRDTFSNFELTLEWNISKGGNSGIFFNVQEAEHLDAVYFSGPEYQLIDDDGFTAPLEPWQKTGANYAMHPPLIEVYRPQGTYNKSRIIVDEGRVQHWLNDRLVVTYNLWSPEWELLKQAGKWKDYQDYGNNKSGHIALQDHGNQIRFRNIKIRRL